MANNIHNRNFVGYGNFLPNPEWPGKARIAVNFVVNYEEGSEYSIENGDGFSESTLTDALPADFSGKRDLAAESLFEYGSRVGFWRIKRIFDQYGVRPTVFGCAMALERNPLATEAIRNAGWDVCSHGWRWIEHWKLSEDEEREHIKKAKESLQRLFGDQQLGWYCRYGPSVNTRRLLVEEGGFLYDSDSYNDELPYWRDVNEKPHLVIPYTLTNNDTAFANGAVGTSSDFFDYVRDSFDYLYEEGGESPKMMSIGLHLRMIGHPARARGLEKLVKYISEKEQVWIARRSDIARHWKENFPPDKIGVM